MVRRTAAERGSAVLLALVAILVVATVVLLLATWVKVQVDSYRVEEGRVQLNALADGSMAETLAQLAADRFFDGVSDRPLGGGRIDSTVDHLSARRARVRARASYRGWVEEIDAVVDLGLAGPRVLSWRRARSRR